MVDWIELGRKIIPPRVRYFLQKFISLSELKLRYREKLNPYSNVTEGIHNEYNSPICFGIVKNSAHYHQHFVAACVELSIPFKVLELSGSNWLDVLKNSDCQVLLAWPDAFFSPRMVMMKDRLEVAEHLLNYPVVPNSKEAWMFEDKHRMNYWMIAHKVPHPKTWIFYDRLEARAFAENCDLPIVFKSAFGASSSGVKIIRKRGELLKLVEQLFSKGFVPNGFDKRDKQWGSLMLQEYFQEFREWRMVRIGDSYFGHPKGKSGDFHSGSGLVEWDVPQDKHLDFLHEVTEKGKFRSMNVDLFEKPNGELFVNELQAVFGAGFSVDQLRVDGVPGRFIRDVRSEEWVFEPGDFAQNACANERVEDSVKQWRKCN